MVEQVLLWGQGMGVHDMPHFRPFLGLILTPACLVFALQQHVPEGCCWSWHTTPRQGMFPGVKPWLHHLPALAD
jgi:hypothetical protein